MTQTATDTRLLRRIEIPAALSRLGTRAIIEATANSISVKTENGTEKIKALDIRNSLKTSQELADFLFSEQSKTRLDLNKAFVDSYVNDTISGSGRQGSTIGLVISDNGQRLSIVDGHSGHRPIVSGKLAKTSFSGVTSAKVKMKPGRYRLIATTSASVFLIGERIPLSATKKREVYDFPLLTISYQD